MKLEPRPVASAGAGSGLDEVDELPGRAGAPPSTGLARRAASAATAAIVGFKGRPWSVGCAAAEDGDRLPPAADGSGGDCPVPGSIDHAAAAGATSEGLGRGDGDAAGGWLAA